MDQKECLARKPGMPRPAPWGGGGRVRKDGHGWKPNPIWLEENVKAGSLKQLPPNIRELLTSPQ